MKKKKIPNSQRVIDAVKQVSKYEGPTLEGWSAGSWREEKGSGIFAIKEDQGPAALYMIMKDLVTLLPKSDSIPTDQYLFLRLFFNHENAQRVIAQKQENLFFDVVSWSRSQVVKKIIGSCMNDFSLLEKLKNLISHFKEETSTTRTETLEIEPQYVPDGRGLYTRSQEIRNLTR